VSILDSMDAEEGYSPGPGRRRPRWFGLLVVLFVLMLVLGGAILGLGALLDSGGSSAPDYSGNGEGETTVTVASGATSAEIGRALVDAKVIKSVQAFTSVAAADDRSRGIQPGYYQLHQHMSAQSALDLMVDPVSRVGAVAIPEGMTTAKVLVKISEEAKIPLADLQAAAAHPDEIGVPAYSRTGTEGYLFPATYDIAPGTSAVDALKMMTAQFKAAAAGLDLEHRAAAMGYRPDQIVTIASIIEGESGRPDDRAKIARVIYNRLEHASSWPHLDMDSTTCYAIGGCNGPLTESQIQSDSPYNTRKVSGLPPGPINNPGEAALSAALDPEPGPWYYFVTLKDQTVFSVTQAEHDRAVQQYNQENNQGNPG
jgi:UPF0755 protein